MHHLAGEYDMELASRGRVPGQDGSDEDRCMEAARPLAAMGRAREVDSLFGTCGRLTTAALPGWWLLEIGREYRAHGHDADARRTLLRARAKYVAAGRGGQDEMPFASFPLGEWQHVRDGWRDTTQLQSAGARGYGQLGIAMAHLGDTARAVVAESTLARSIHHPDGHALLWVAMIEEALGHRARALDYLRQAVAEGVPAAVMLHTHASTGFASMRGDPAFEVWRQGR